MGTNFIRDWLENESALPPYLPEGFTQHAPFVISKVNGLDRVDIGSICLGFDRPGGYTVEYNRSWTVSRTYVDADLRLHEAKPGYKLQDPPAFDTFEEAVQVAERALEATSFEYVRKGGVNLETGVEDWLD